MLQRYRINNCADIAEDGGGYCLSEDVAELESELQKSKWISVFDEFPPVSSKWYLISTRDSNGNKMTTMGFFERVGDDALWLAHNDKTIGYDEWENVNHWQPLPAPK